MFTLPSAAAPISPSQHDGGHVRTPSGELASGASASLMSWHRTFHPPVDFQRRHGCTWENVAVLVADSVHVQPKRVYRKTSTSRFSINSVFGLL